MLWSLPALERISRQTEREGNNTYQSWNTVRTAGQLNGEPTLNRGPQSIFIPRVQEVGWGSCGSFADWMRHVSWVWGRVRQILSPCALGGGTGYTAQEDQKSVSHYNVGEGRTIKVFFFFPFLHSKTLLGFVLFCFFHILLSLGHHTLFFEKIFKKQKTLGILLLFPVGTVIPINIFCIF